MPIALIVAAIVLLIGTVLTIFAIVTVQSLAHAKRAVAAAEAAGLECYVQTGGGQIGWLYVSMPLARLVVTRESALLSMPLRHIDLARATVTNVRMAGATGNAVRFEPADPNQRRPVMFWSTNRSGLVEALERFGWRVER